MEMWILAVCWKRKAIKELFEHHDLGKTAKLLIVEALISLL